MQKSAEMPSKEEISKIVERSARFRPLGLHDVAKHSTSARRALFGPIDHQENARVLTELSDRLNEQASIRWNFDFLNGAPLTGRYEWSLTEAMDNREPAGDADDVNDRVNNATSGVHMVEVSAVDVNDSKTPVSDEISPTFASSSSPKYEQMIRKFLKSPSKRIIRRLTWAPKKKIRFLSPKCRRSVREATIPGKRFETIHFAIQMFLRAKTYLKVSMGPRSANQHLKRRNWTS